jgi:hypothetical protein
MPFERTPKLQTLPSENHHSLAGHPGCFAEGTYQDHAAIGGKICVLGGTHDLFTLVPYPF